MITGQIGLHISQRMCLIILEEVAQVTDLGEGEFANIRLASHLNEGVDALAEVFGPDALALPYSEIDALGRLLLGVGLFVFEPPNEADVVAISYSGLLFFELLQLVDGLGYFGSVIHRQSYNLLILNQYEE